MSRHLVTTGAVLFAILAACAQQPVPEASSTEHLLAQPPPGWQLTYQLNNVDTRLVDFVPAGETQTEWTTKVSFESHSQLVVMDPIEMLISEVESEKDKCSFVQDFNLFSGFENNYPTSTRLIFCGENKFAKKGEVSLFKVIKGNDYFYIIRMVKRIPAFEADKPGIDESEIATWSNYLRRIRVCDTADNEHPCPVAPAAPDK